MDAIAMFSAGPNRESAQATLILAHGAGAPADSPFMEALCAALASHGVHTLRFEFPYMERRRADGRKRPPDRQPVLLDHFRQVITQVSGQHHRLPYIGGKSMGGRMASLLAAEPEIENKIGGCVCFGYPFHPPGKLDRWRTDHFVELHSPMLIVQGTRDPFGKRDEVLNRQSEFGAKVVSRWLDGGNHDFKPLAKQEETQGMLIAEAARSVASFMLAGR